MEVLQRTANRGSISTGGHEIDNSCKFEADNTEKIQSAESDAGNRKTWTFSIWCKRTELGSGNFALWSIGDSFIGFEADKLMVSLQYSGSSDFRFKTNRLFRDTSAFYHIVVAVDTTQGTDTNRLKIYVNGVQETSFSSTGAGYPSQNFDTGFVIGSNTDHPIGNSAGGDAGFCGYLSEILFIDTLQKAPTDFGEFDDDSGIWIPKKYSGAFPGRSFWYEFKNSGSMGTDSSGNSHTGLLNNITAADQATDTPTNNFCTLNPLYAMTYPLTISEGGTKSVASGAVAQWQSAKGSMAVNNGKWYWETSNFTEMNTFIGLQSADLNGVYNGAYTLNVPLNDNNLYFSDPSNRSEGFTTTKATSDVWGLALNMDDGQLSVYRNGTLQNATVSIDGLIGNGPYTPIISQYASATNASTNFGGYNSGKAISSAATDESGYGTFEYAPPTGYYALCTKNLAEFG